MAEIGDEVAVGVLGRVVKIDGRKRDCPICVETELGSVWVNADDVHPVEQCD